ncbi:MAG: hypothetical protein GPJ54_08360 [Candidatus Heimdallarchaeota archaeon]|nr:hypothetical protein [Candidatus Heimdallarchaeota archaeon]
MKKISSLFLGLLLLQVVNSPVNNSADAAAKVTYSNYDIQKDQWTNVTLFPNSYSINSDFVLYDQLQGEFLNSPWDLIVDKIEEENFFSLEISATEPIAEIKMDYLGDSNTITFDKNVSNIDGLLGILENIHQRLTGGYNDVFYWVTDLTIGVMESYPEQYGITASFQMANGLFSSVTDENVTLIVADYDINAQYIVDPNGNITYIAREKLTMDVSGETVKIQFATFSVGVNYSPSDLYFYVILENGVFLMSSAQHTLPVPGISSLDISGIQVTQHDINSKVDEDTENLELPILYLWFVIPLFVVPIIRKHYR